MSVDLISSIWRVSRTHEPAKRKFWCLSIEGFLCTLIRVETKKVQNHEASDMIWFDKWTRAEDPWHGSPKLGAAALVDLTSDESEFATIALINMGPKEGWRRKKPVAWSPWDLVRLRNCAWWGKIPARLRANTRPMRCAAGPSRDISTCCKGSIK
jgi:hypothetical protein